VTGDLREDVDIETVLSELMPPGSVSGAPKSSALSIISENEIPRGPYCGALGWWDGRRAEIAVGIRTFWKINDSLFFGTGAGITWGSDPMQEWEETELKARKLISLVSQ
jgi:para-aminobenzoate synthetase component 1